MTLLESSSRVDEPRSLGKKHATARAAERLFAQCPYGSLRELVCEFDEGRLVLRGKVPTFYLKSIAQTVARGVAGVREIENQVEVVEADLPSDY